jgi:hypothetical protein
MTGLLYRLAIRLLDLSGRIGSPMLRRIGQRLRRWVLR